MALPILTIIGATGTQGSSVLNHALKAGQYKVRAVLNSQNRDSNQVKAQNLEAKGVEVVFADLNDKASLITAFKVLPNPPFQSAVWHLIARSGFNNHIRRNRFLPFFHP